MADAARRVAQAMTRQGGMSVPTQRAMANEPDLDRGLHEMPQGMHYEDNQLGHDPTQRVPQQQYDQMLQQQKADQERAYQQYKNRGHR